MEDSPIQIIPDIKNREYSIAVILKSYESYPALFAELVS
jgi:hypothetical protein